MSGGLQRVDDGPPRCVICGAEAAGPCMRCHALVCGDCCVLTEGGVGTYAICTRCDRKGGRDVGSAWGPVLKLFAAVVGGVVVFAIVVIVGTR